MLRCALRPRPGAQRLARRTQEKVERQRGVATSLQKFPVSQWPSASSSCYRLLLVAALGAPPKESWGWGGRGVLEWAWPQEAQPEGPKLSASSPGSWGFLGPWQQWVDSRLSLVAVALAVGRGHNKGLRAGRKSKVFKAYVNRLPNSCLAAWSELSQAHSYTLALALGLPCLNPSGRSPALSSIL